MVDDNNKWIVVINRKLSTRNIYTVTMNHRWTMNRSSFVVVVDKVPLSMHYICQKRINCLLKNAFIANCMKWLKKNIGALLIKYNNYCLLIHWISISLKLEKWPSLCLLDKKFWSGQSKTILIFKHIFCDNTRYYSSSDSFVLFSVRESRISAKNKVGRVIVKTTHVLTLLLNRK